MILDVTALSVADRQYYLQHVIAPRPVCFASTIDREGAVNLSPFSFFNMFSANPPVVVFSPARRVRDNTTKHTLKNVLEVPEVVINIVTWDMVQQVSLASCEFPKGVDEFVKAGFTKEAASRVRPPMVKESKAKLECRVIEIKSLGDQAGAGQLVICEVLVLHVDDELLDGDKKFDQARIDHVARLGGDWYCRVTPESLFMVPKPNRVNGIGIDSLPESIRFSRHLTGNHLGMLANSSTLPEKEPGFRDEAFEQLLQHCGAEQEETIHRHAASLLDLGEAEKAWQILLRSYIDGIRP